MKGSKKIGYGGLVGLLLIAYIFYFAINQTIHLNLFPRYTVGEVIEVYRSGHAVKKISYKFTVSANEYEQGKNYLGAEFGKRYYVKFSYKNPNHSVMLQDKPVSDSITYIPPEGWKELPE